MTSIGTRRLFICTVLLMNCTLSRAKPYNPFDDFDLNKNTPVICKSIATKEEHEFYWSDTKFGINNVPERLIAPVFMKQIDGLSRKAQGIRTPGRFKDAVILTRLESEIVESENRSTFFFRTPLGTAMLTLWDMVADGGQVIVIKDFLNASIGDIPAAIAIAYSAGTKKLIWSVTVIRSGLSYEFKIPDVRTDKEETKLSKNEVLEIVKGIVKTNHSKGTSDEPYCHN